MRIPKLLVPVPLQFAVLPLLLFAVVKRFLLSALLFLFALIPLSAMAQNKDNLPNNDLIAFDFVKPTIEPFSGDYLKFDGIWVSDGHTKDDKVVTQESLVLCDRDLLKPGQCVEFDHTPTIELSPMDVTALEIKEWNKHRIRLEAPISPSAPCPIQTSIVVNFDTGYVKSYEVPLRAQWSDSGVCDRLKELLETSETLAVPRLANMAPGVNNGLHFTAFVSDK